MPSMSLIELLTLLAVLLAGRIIYSLALHPLAKFPGPKLAAVSNVWYARAVASKQPHLRILELHRKYGPVVRIAPNELSFDTLASRNDIYSHQAARKFPKGAMYDGFINEGEPSLVAVRDPVAHGKKRKFLAHAFSAAALKSHEPLIQQYVHLFERQVAIHGTQPTGIDLTKWYHWFTADVVGDLAFGESFRCLESTSTHPWVAIVDKHASTIIRLDVLRRFPLLRKAVSPFMMRPDIIEARKQNYEFSRDRVRKRLAMKTDRKDFMSYLLDQPDEDGMLNDQFLTVSASTFVVAGSETTATALASITYWVLKTPGVLQKAFDELQTRFASAEDIQPWNIHGLPYLNACIEEGLRLVPPSPNGPVRVSPGAVISGFYVPEGTDVASHPVAINRNPDNFRNPNHFVPERWLEGKDKLEASQPFLIGPRACIGRNLANLEMRLLLAKIIYIYDMKLLDHKLDWDRDAKVETFWSKPPLMVRFTKR